jgi:hypothetical protein
MGEGMSAKVGEREKALRAMREQQATTVQPGTLAAHEAGIRSAMARGEAAFAEVGERLKAIRDGRLYKATHNDFDSYCREVWGSSRSAADRLIAGHNVVRGLLAGVGVTPNGSNSDEIVIPQNEAQARDLAQAPPEERPEVMREAAAEGPATARTIRKAVQRRKGTVNDASLIFGGRVQRLADVLDLDPAAMAQQSSVQTVEAVRKVHSWLDAFLVAASQAA